MSVTNFLLLLLLLLFLIIIIIIKLNMTIQKGVPTDLHIISSSAAPLEVPYVRMSI